MHFRRVLFTALLSAATLGACRTELKVPSVGPAAAVNGQRVPAKFYPDHCREAWSTWVADFASPSPFTTFNKMSSWPVSPDDVRAVAESQSRYQEETKERRDDDQHIIDNFEKIVKRAPRSVLVVFWAGLRHAFHMFLSQTAENVLYAAHPMRENASFFGSDTVEALALAGQSMLLPKLLGPRERASFIHQLPLVALTKYVDAGYRYNPTQLLASNTTGTEHVVVVADWHFLNDTSLGDNLPEADCLSSLGFTQVLVVLENFEYGDKITDSVFDEKQDIRTVLRARAAARIANSPRLRELLEKGDVDMFPNYSAVRRKLKSYATVVPVWFTGME